MSPSDMNDTVCPAITLDYQLAEDITQHDRLPSSENLSKWIRATLAGINHSKAIEVCIRVVSEHESQSLNANYRNKDKPTNVLSFESDLPDFVDSDYIGDLVVCAAVLEQESEEQHKVLEQHWAHICIHGLLHLLGYDHMSEQEAEKMEAIEVAILAELNIGNPYQVN